MVLVKTWSKSTTRSSPEKWPMLSYHERKELKRHAAHKEVPAWTSVVRSAAHFTYSVRFGDPTSSGVD